MPPLAVMLLRALALAAVAGGFATAHPALGATGGAALPGGSLPSEPVSPAAPATPSGSAPGAEAPTTPVTTADAVAAPAALVPQLPALPVLATAARRADDPVAKDLAALGSPSPIAAIDGHVVVVRNRMSRSELVDLADPSSPRVLLASTRIFGTPLAGRDAAGRAVVVASPCAGVDAVLRTGAVPKCPLRAIDLISGSSRALPSTTGALAGDLAGPRLLFTRSSPTTGVRLYESVDGGAAKSSALPLLGQAGDGWTAATGKPIPGTLAAPAFDVDGSGRIAIVLEYSSRSPRVSSGLWLRTIDGDWRRLAAVNTTMTDLGTRHVLGPQLDAAGTDAYVEGVVETPSYLGRWTDDGAETTHLSIRRSIGRSTILSGVALDGSRLLFVDWSPGAPCGSVDALACGLRALAPVSVT
jgi:hypothetical protein